MSMYNTYPKVIKAHCAEDPLDRLRYHVSGAIERGEKEAIAEVPALNHVCCVCQVSLNNRPFNPNLQTSHGYCEACLEVALSNIGGSHENN